MSGIGKDEDRIQLAADVVGPLDIVRAYAGWIVSSQSSADELTPKQQALVGQAANRAPALMLHARTADGSVIHQTYTIDREPLAELMIELVSTFLDRDMFKQLVAVLPEDWSR